MESKKNNFLFDLLQVPRERERDGNMMASSLTSNFHPPDMAVL